MTADFACKTINPEDTDGPKVDAVFPGYLTSKCFNVTLVNYWNLIAAKYVLENVKRIFTGVRDTTKAVGAIRGDLKNGT